MFSHTKTGHDQTGEVNVVLRSLLEQQPPGELVVRPKIAPLDQRRIAMLDQRAVTTIAEARDLGVDIEYLGVHPLFSQPRLYDGHPHDWILGPANRANDLVVPKQEQAVLRHLANGDIEFPLIYIAHETDKEKTKELPRSTTTAHTDIDESIATEVIGPVPEPIESVKLGEKLEHRSKQALKAVRRTAIAGGAVVAAPVVLAGSALAAIGQLDPIVIGALPAGEPREGTPAAYFVLARWDW